MINRSIAACWLFGCVALSGCAGLDAKTIDGEDTTEASARGLRYYLQSPYLLVFTDNKGGLSSQIVYLSDTSSTMSVQPYSYLASNEVTLKFDHGALTNASVTADETVVPKAVLESLKSVLTTAVKGGLAFNAPGVVSAQTTAPTPSLFKIVVEGDTVKLLGGQAQNADGTKTVKTSTVVP
jgi:hypothetical protein